MTTSSIPLRSKVKNGSANKLLEADRAAHDWYRFVLSFPPQLVRVYIARFGVTGSSCVLDPFCGTGTTLVECQKQGIPSIGIEANPMAHFASMVKTDWKLDPDQMIAHASNVADAASGILEADGIPDDPILCLEAKPPYPLRTLPTESMELLLTNSISSIPLHKTLVLLECLKEYRRSEFDCHERLALAKALVTAIGNLQFGPEVGVGTLKQDASVVNSWIGTLSAMADDLRALISLNNVRAVVHHADARNLSDLLAPRSVDAVITSPPYPNEKDYTRTTRLESVLLGFIRNKAELRTLKQGLVRSNTRSVYRGDDDDHWIRQMPEIEEIAQAIEARRIELGKTSGFERLYGRVTKLYFGGMARHLAQLRPVLKPGASLAYVVGDQASYLRIMIPTGQLLAKIAQSLGYEVVGIDLFRTRLATTTREQLREEVVVLRWPGNTGFDLSGTRAIG